MQNIYSNTDILSTCMKKCHAKHLQQYWYTEHVHEEVLCKTFTAILIYWARSWRSVMQNIYSNTDILSTFMKKCYAKHLQQYWYTEHVREEVSCKTFTAILIYWARSWRSVMQNIYSHTDVLSTCMKKCHAKHLQQYWCIEHVHEEVSCKTFTAILIYWARSWRSVMQNIYSNTDVLSTCMKKCHAKHLQQYWYTEHVHEEVSCKTFTAILIYWARSWRSVMQNIYSNTDVLSTCMKKCHAKHLQQYWYTEHVHEEVSCKTFTAILMYWARAWRSVMQNIYSNTDILSTFMKKCHAKHLQQYWCIEHVHEEVSCKTFTAILKYWARSWRSVMQNIYSNTDILSTFMKKCHAKHLQQYWCIEHVHEEVSCKTFTLYWARSWRSVMQNIYSNTDVLSTCMKKCHAKHLQQYWYTEHVHEEVSCKTFTAILIYWARSWRSVMQNIYSNTDILSTFMKKCHAKHLQQYWCIEHVHEEVSCKTFTAILIYWARSWRSVMQNIYSNTDVLSTCMKKCHAKHLQQYWYTEHVHEEVSCKTFTAKLIYWARSWRSVMQNIYSNTDVLSTFMKKCHAKHLQQYWYTEHVHEEVSCKTFTAILMYWSWRSVMQNIYSNTDILSTFMKKCHAKHLQQYWYTEHVHEEVSMQNIYSNTDILSTFMKKCHAKHLQQYWYTKHVHEEVSCKTFTAILIYWARAWRSVMQNIYSNTDVLSTFMKKCHAKHLQQYWCIEHVHEEVSCKHLQQYWYTEHVHEEVSCKTFTAILMYWAGAWRSVMQNIYSNTDILSTFMKKCHAKHLQQYWCIEHVHEEVSCKTFTAILIYWARSWRSVMQNIYSNTDILSTFMKKCHAKHLQQYWYTEHVHEEVSCKHLQQYWYTEHVHEEVSCKTFIAILIYWARSWRSVMQNIYSNTDVLSTCMKKCHAKHLQQYWYTEHVHEEVSCKTFTAILMYWACAWRSVMQNIYSNTDILSTFMKKCQCKTFTAILIYWARSWRSVMQNIYSNTDILSTFMKKCHAKHLQQYWYTEHVHEEVSCKTFTAILIYWACSWRSVMQNIYSNTDILSTFIRKCHAKHLQQYWCIEHVHEEVSCKTFTAILIYWACSWRSVMQNIYSNTDVLSTCMKTCHAKHLQQYWYIEHVHEEVSCKTFTAILMYWARAWRSVMQNIYSNTDILSTFMKKCHAKHLQQYWCIEHVHEEVSCKTFTAILIYWARAWRSVMQNIYSNTDILSTCMKKCHAKHLQQYWYIEHVHDKCHAKHLQQYWCIEHVHEEVSCKTFTAILIYWARAWRSVMQNIYSNTDVLSTCMKKCHAKHLQQYWCIEHVHEEVSCKTFTF